jgi:hypothetical protein
VTGAAPAAPHTDAVVSLLEAAGLLVGRGVQPAGAGWQGEPGRSAHRPYVVLYPAPGLTDGTLGDTYAYLDYTVQATCVGATQQAAERVMDAAKTALVGARLTLANRASYAVQALLEQPARRDDQVTPPVHYSVAQFRVRTQTA